MNWWLPRTEKREGIIGRNHLMSKGFYFGAKKMF